MLRFALLVGLTLASATWAAPAGAQDKPGRPTNAEDYANNLRFRSCIKFPGVTRTVRLLGTFDESGMITEFKELQPEDSDEYRASLELAKAEALRCQPYKLYPPEKYKGTFTLPFDFYVQGQRSPHLTQELLNAWYGQILYCGKVPATGPTVRVRVKYAPNGTVDGDVVVLGPNDSPEHLGAVADVLEAIKKCQPIILPAANYENWRVITSSFHSAQKREEMAKERAESASKAGASTASEAGKSP